MEHWWNDADSGKPKYLEKDLFHASLSAAHPTWTGFGLIQGLGSQGLVSDCQSRCMVIIEGHLQYCGTRLMEHCHVYFFLGTMNTIMTFLQVCRGN